MKSKHLVEVEALAFLESLQRPPLSGDNLRALRALAQQQSLAASFPSRLENIVIKRAVAAGAEGGPEVPLVVYTPNTGTALRRAILHIHGGGYVAGDAEGEAYWAAWLAAELNSVVVSPNYRLAPETVHPGPVMDCYAGLNWLYEQCQSLNVDRKHIAVFGGSAGGGLAAALALLARDRSAIPLAFQCLLYPMLDDRTVISADPNAFAGEYAWTRSDNAFGWTALLGDEPGGPCVSPYASAARATDLSGLPPAYIWVGALDLFIDESIEYARRLIRAGVPTELHVHPGVTHGNILVAGAPSSLLCRDEILRVLRKGL